MKTIHLLALLCILSSTLVAQNVGIGTSTPAEKLEVLGKIKTQNFQMTNGAASNYLLQTDASGNATWVPSSSIADHGGIIPFSTGIVLYGASVTSPAPILMGFGNSTVEVINASGESTMPPEAGGFAFTVPFSGSIKNLQISADLYVGSLSAINVIPLVYEFTVHVSPSTPNNGIGHISSQYLTTPFSSTLTFGGPSNPVTPGNFYSATNINLGSLTVNAGDRVGIRVRTVQSSNPAASDIQQLSFNASLFYSY